MPRNKLNDLRDHLFETIEALKDDEKPLDIARAKAICEVAQTIINSAKVEVDALNTLRAGEGTGFFEVKPDRMIEAAKSPKVMRAS